MNINNEGMGEYKATGLPISRVENDATNEPFVTDDVLKEIFSFSELRDSSKVPLLNRKWMQKSIEDYNHKLSALKGFAEKLAAHFEGTDTGEAFKLAGAEINLDNDKSNPSINVLFENQVKSFGSTFKKIFNLALNCNRHDELKELKAKVTPTDKPFAAFLENAIQTQSLIFIMGRYRAANPDTTKVVVEGLIEIAGPEIAAQVLADELEKLRSEVPEHLRSKWDKACSNPIRTALQGNNENESRLLAAFKLFRATDNPADQYETLLLLLKCNTRLVYLDKAFETLCKMQGGARLPEDRVTVPFKRLMDTVEDKDLLTQFIKGLEPRCHSRNEFTVLALLEECLPKRVEKNDEGEKGGRCTIS